MAVTFPNSPTLNQEYTAENGLIYIWDGEKWKTQGSYAGDQGLYINKDGSNTAIYADSTSVGIGTTTPSEELEVVGTALISGPSAADATLELNSGSTAESLGIKQTSTLNEISSEHSVNLIPLHQYSYLPLYYLVIYDCLNEMPVIVTPLTDGSVGLAVLSRSILF